MGRRALSGLALACLTAAVTSSAAGADPFGSMSALRVTPAEPGPSVTFKTLDGTPATLAHFRGRPVLLTFFTTW